MTTEIRRDAVLAELWANVIRYAYHHEPSQLICLGCELTNAGVIFRIRDFGMQCEPSKLKGRPLDLVQPGGLGIHLIRRAFDQVDYHLKKEGTELVLAKHFSKAPEPA